MSALTDILRDSDFRTGDPDRGYLVTRRGAPTFTAGVATAGSATTFWTGPAILRPLRGRELQALAEGYHADDVRKLMTTADVRVGPPPDEVTIDGEVWKAIGAAATTAFGGTHRAITLARTKTP